MKKNRILSLVIAVIMVVSVLPIQSGAVSKGFRFSSDGKFKILQLSDPQDDAHPAKELDRYIRTAIENTDPDLVVITGDIVEDSRFGDVFSDDEKFSEGVNVYNKDKSLNYEATLENVKAACKAVFTPIEEAGIPFAVTQGNNDYKSKISNEDWLEIYESYPHCITRDMSNDAEGHIDQYVEIFNHETYEPAFGLWLLDNGTSFTESQNEWFKNKKTNDVPSIVFEHVPVAEVGNLFEQCKIWDSGALVKSGKAYRLNKDIANGTYYCVYTPGQSSDQFAAWTDKGVVGAFFGHIHTDGYTGTWGGIEMGLTYGCEFAKAGPYGYRTITVSEDSTYETELFTYNKGEASPQEYTQYPEYSNVVQRIACSVLGIFTFVYRSLDALLKF